MKENVNHPNHYNSGSIETIEVIESQNWGIPFCLGNALKYITRAEHKGKFEEDLEKAIWYVNRAITEYKKKVESCSNTE